MVQRGRTRPVPLSAAIIASDPEAYSKTLVDWRAWVDEGLIHGVYRSDAIEALSPRSAVGKIATDSRLRRNEEKVA